MRPMTKRESVEYTKQLLKTKKPLRVKTDLLVGNLIFTSYRAKDQERVWDTRPMFLVLRRSRGYTLGLNFHWIPRRMREWLIRYIIRQNKKRGNKNLVQISYRKLRPLLKKLGYAPCIRLYINRRFGRRCVNIPHDQFLNCALMDTAVFSHGLSSEEIYKMILTRKRHKK